MAPPKTSKGKGSTNALSAKKTRSSSNPLTQATLPFPSRRSSSSASAAKTKPKPKTETRSSAVVHDEELSSEVEDDDEMDEVETLDGESQKEVRVRKERDTQTQVTGGEPAPKRRKLARNTSAGDVQEKLARVNGGREVKTTSVAATPVRERRAEDEERKELNVKDRRWNKQLALAKERNGNLPPIHTQGENKINHILRVFDLSYEYGPCVGVTRLERWERAELLGLNPPPEIHEILTTTQGVEEDEHAQCVFYGEV